MRSNVVFIFILFLSSIFYGQTQKKVDSLNQLISTTASKEYKAEAYIQLADIFIDSQRDKSDDYLREALKLNKNINNDTLLGKIYYKLGVLNYKDQKDDVAMSFFLKMDSLFDERNIVNEDLVQTKFYQSQILKFTFTKEGLLQSKQHLDKMLKYATKIDDSLLLNWGYQKMGGYYGVLSEIENAEKNLDTALLFYRKAERYFSENRDYAQLITTFWSIASLEERKGNIKEAEKYQELRIATSEYLDDSADKGIIFKSVGDFYIKNNKPREGLKLLERANQLFENYGYPNAHDEVEMLHYQAEAHYKLGAIEEAFRFKNLELKLSDSLNKASNKQKALELETKYQTDKKQQEITLLKTENALAEQQKKNQRNLLLGGLGLTTVAGIFLFLGYRNRKKTNDILRELDATKSNFFANISHEFRTPLSLIAGPIQEQLQKPDLPAREKQNLQTAQRNSQRLVTLVDQLLDLSKLESGHFKLKVKQGRLATFLKSLGSSFEFLAQEKGQDYDTQVDIPEDTYCFDADALEKITTNLLSNAIKYSPENATVHFNAILVNGILNLTVKNSGTTLSKDVLATLFNRFQRADEGSVGSGIGLALTKELVELHKGTIAVKNENNEMVFEVQLPVTREAFTEEECYEGMIATPIEDENAGTYDAATSTTLSTSFAKTETSTIPETEEKDIFSKNTNPILLIVDDNEDLRNYVRSIFQDSYTIHTAENGKIGFEIAKETVPDLIITDLMMPEEDGLVFTKNCKSTEATSHIPVLMLTAKAGDENQLKGLETGADAYITKPFNTEILKTTANNLLESRKRLQERFSQEVVLLPKDIATNSIEEKFLENLQAVMDEKLIESDFNTEDFAQALGMSRMQLHRKLKALTGLSATEFVRSQRLKLAAQLLKKSDINVSQVGYSVGFNNHSYFTKCFKEQYGIAPSDYAKKS
ncbi:response regulator [Dokdonia sinensis]|uniref:histidine kinase n=1 Tax=Dokdonia sinensis TaxID=2479847 RepID=A0A3M0FVN2_9FLAO|nr:response regulator [Dokdonia sinensis]RMB56731.1 response regulator [Dokdonia sinensis]